MASIAQHGVDSVKRFPSSVLGHGISRDIHGIFDANKIPVRKDAPLPVHQVYCRTLLQITKERIHSEDLLKS